MSPPTQISGLPRSRADPDTADVSFEMGPHRSLAFRTKSELQRPNWLGLIPTARVSSQEGGATLPTNPAPRRVDPFMRPGSSTRPAMGGVVSLQKWEGYVLEVTNDGFIGRLADITDGHTEEEADFSMDEISPDDVALVQPGAGFYWSIGHQTDLTGRQRSVSELRFRRLPAWTPEERAEAEKEAKELAPVLGLGSGR